MWALRFESTSPAAAIARGGNFRLAADTELALGDAYPRQFTLDDLA